MPFFSKISLRSNLLETSQMRYSRYKHGLRGNCLCFILIALAGLLIVVIITASLGAGNFTLVSLLGWLENPSFDFAKLPLADDIKPPN